MKKRILAMLLSALLSINLIACDIIPNDGSEGTGENIDTTEQTVQEDENGMADTQTSDITTPCTHIFGEWSVSKAATEREDGEEKRTCSQCNHFETKPIHATGTEGLLFTLSEDGTSYSVSAGTATEGDVFIPAYHNGLPVTSIGYIGWDNNVEPEDVEVGSYAFMKCINLKTIVIPSTVTVIGDMAFANCESLENIVLPPTVTVIGAAAFEFCKSLKSIGIPPAVTKIGEYAFLLCENLESIVIPESVKEIGENAFALTEEEFSFSYYNSDITVSIPNSQTILLLREFSSFFSWGVEIYYLDENGSEVLIEKVGFDNSSISPFSDGNFEIINNDDNTFSVRAAKDTQEERWLIDKTFDLPQCVSVFVPKPEDTITVFYGGSSSEAWDAIDISKENTRLEKDNMTVKRSVIYFYSETNPNEANKFWHYVDGIPTLW